MFSLLFSSALAAPPTPPAAAGMSKGGDEGEMMQHWAQIADELKLDDKQRDALEKLYYDSRMARADLTAKEEKARLELERQMLADTFDEKACTKAFEAQLSADAELRRNRFALQVGLRKVLTAEQWTELSAIKSERRQAAREMHSGKGGMGGAPMGGGKMGGGQMGGSPPGGMGSGGTPPPPN